MRVKEMRQNKENKSLDYSESIDDSVFNMRRGMAEVEVSKAETEEINEEKKI